MTDRRYHDEHAPQPPSLTPATKEEIQKMDFSDVELRAIAQQEKKNAPKSLALDGIEVIRSSVGLVVSASEHNRSIADFRTTLIDIRTLIDAAYRVDTPAALINSLGEIGRLVDKAINK